MAQSIKSEQPFLKFQTVRNNNEGRIIRLVIRTFEHEYPVIGVKQQTEQYDVYICRDVSGNCLCRILSIKDKSLFAELVSWLTDNINREAFADYREHFIYDGQLCIVMKYTQGVNLASKLATENVPFRERMELARKILEKVVIQEIPDYFLAKCFLPEQMIIAQDLSVSFNYPIEDIITDRQQNGRENIVSVFRLIFQRELDRKVPDLLMDFIKKLPGLTEKRMMDVYSEYYILMGKLENYNEKDEQPKTFWYKLWDKIKQILGVLKKALIIILIVLSVCYLIYTIIDPGKNKTSNGHFHSIGTVDIVRSG